MYNHVEFDKFVPVNASGVADLTDDRSEQWPLALLYEGSVRGHT